jgi:hypothetical protein
MNTPPFEVADIIRLNMQEEDIRERFQWTADLIKHLRERYVDFRLGS